MHLVYPKKQTKQNKINVLKHYFRFLSGRPLETMAMQVFFSGEEGGRGVSKVQCGLFENGFNACHTNYCFEEC